MFKLMKIKDFAKEMQVPESTIYTWKNRGNIPLECFKKIGGSWYVRIDKMQEFLAR